MGYEVVDAISRGGGVETELGDRSLKVDCGTCWGGGVEPAQDAF